MRRRAILAALGAPARHPAQGLLIAALSVLLARQPLDTVCPAYAAVALAAAAAVLGASIRPVPATLVAAAIAVASGLAIDLPPKPRALPPAARPLVSRSPRS